MLAPILAININELLAVGNCHLPNFERKFDKLPN